MMHEDINISVITPVRNGEKFIEFCIKNVISQNCPFAEHVIVDGNSTDKTVDIIEHYSRQYSHIRWISEDDDGQSNAMNKGIDLARGQIISFLNSDDFYEPNALNQAVELFQRLPEPSLLVGNCYKRDEDNNIILVNMPLKLKITDLLLGTHINEIPINPSAYFYHKSLHDLIGLYDINDHYTLDIDFIFRAVQVANTKYVNRSFGNIRHLPGTKTYETFNNGEGPKYREKIYKKYRRGLPLNQRIVLRLRLLGNMIYRRIKTLATFIRLRFPTRGRSHYR